MTPRALLHGARQAVKLARRCERSSLDYDDAWHDKMIFESEKARERAAWYLDRRAMLLRQPELPL